MKKIMMAMLVVACAAGVQAATVNWQMAGAKSAKIYGADGTTVFGKTAGDTMYLINADSLNSILSAMGGDSFNAATTEGIFGSTTTFSATHGGMTASLTSDDKLTAGQQYNFAVLLIQGDKYMVSTSQSKFPSTAEAPTNITWSNSTHLAGAGATWQSIPTESIPEPTSGLLLLLGVAGLALKRKRA